MTTTYTVLSGQVVTAGKDLASRVVRQVLQALTPTLLVVAAGSLQGVDFRAVAILAGITALVTFLRWLTDFRVAASAPIVWQVLDRALAAGAGTALGFFGDDLTGTAVDWSGAITAAVGSAVLAVVMTYSNPPVIPADEIESDSNLPGDL